VTSRILTLIKKDLLLFRRDRFYFLITVMGLVMYIVVYLIMPRTVDETLKLGVYAPGIPEIAAIDTTLALEQGIDLKVFDTVEDLRDAVAKNEYSTGLVLPENFMTDLAAGKRPTVTLYFTAAVPEEVQAAISAMVNELASQAAGQSVLLELHEEVLGADLLGNQIPWRDRLIPIMVIMILGTEMLSLSSLISTELEQRTIRALLVTPLSLGNLLSAKAILGTSMAFIQVVLFVAIVGGLSQQPLVMVLVLIIGSIMVTGIGFLVASLARDMMGVTAWGMIVLIIFVIPALGAMIPGMLSDWAKVIPSYHLTDAVVQLVNYGAGIGAVTNQILIMLGWTAVFTVIGVIALRRRYV
jgi:ABC-2 type transport system permease protein